MRNSPRQMRAAIRHAVLACLVLFVAGCQAGYYLHVIRGQSDVLTRREPIARLVADPATEAALKERLLTALQARSHAIDVLALPDTGSYTSYADLERPYAMWSVFAAPELSLEPLTWCYPFAGCLPHRSYYDEAMAQAEAARLAADGHDVHVGGVPAYSTIGWFDDPLLSSMLRGGDQGLAATIFHELAHERVFARSDPAFSESYATFVEREGLRSFLAGQPEALAAAEARARRHDEFVQLMLEARARLGAVFASDGTDAQKRAGKKAEFDRLRSGYAALRVRWGGYAGYDGWFESGINNAFLLPFGVYHGWVPAFQSLFRQAEGDWKAFHRAVERLAQSEPEERRNRLEELQARP